MTEAGPALHAAAAGGKFFTLVETPDGPGWRSVDEVISEGSLLDRRVEHTRRGLAHSCGVTPHDVPSRTAASVDLLGLAARIVSPALGAAVLGGVVPDFGPDRLWIRTGAPSPAGAAAVTGTRVATAQQAADAFDAYVVRPVLVPLVAAYAEHYRLSSQVLRGNLASAVHGAATVLLSLPGPALIDPRDVQAVLVGSGSLAGTARTTTPRFVRNSCCLWYRIPGSSLCGDCVLTAS